MGNNELNRNILKHKHFMRVSVSASKLSTCARNKVGCVLTSMDDMLLSTGFNGTPIGVDHCTVTNPQKFTPCNCLHAEQNAIIRCEESWRTNKIAYVTVFPCFSCAKLLVGINVKQIYYLHDYRDMKKSVDFFYLCGVQHERIK